MNALAKPVALAVDLLSPSIRRALSASVVNLLVIDRVGIFDQGLVLIR
jgi:hypothetical protein